MGFGSYLFGRYISHVIAQRVIGQGYADLFESMKKYRISVEAVEAIYEGLENIRHSL
jgi:hypothetical protein